jgi:hypothetical protein
MTTTIEFITALFWQVDGQLAGLPTHPEAHLWPSEVVTLGLLHALKGVGNRPFSRWLTRGWCPCNGYKPIFAAGYGSKQRLLCVQKGNVPDIGTRPRDATKGCVRSTGGRAPAPARRGVSGPRRALRPRRHRAVVHCADLPPRHQARQCTGDRPLGEAGGLAHLGRSEPLCPRGCEGRQDRPLPTGGPGVLSATPSSHSGALPRGKTPRHSAAGSAPRQTRPPRQSLRGTCGLGPAASPCRLNVRAGGPS